MSWKLHWDESFAVGITRIDQQHKAFVDLVNTINTKHDGGASKELLARYLHEIYYYVFYHFYSEENLMREVKYPERATQERAHKEFLEDFTKKIRMWGENNLPLEPVVRSLFNWFIGHIADEDVKIGVFLRQYPG